MGAATIQNRWGVPSAAFLSISALFIFSCEQLGLSSARPSYVASMADSSSVSVPVACEDVRRELSKHYYGDKGALSRPKLGDGVSIRSIEKSGDSTLTLILNRGVCKRARSKGPTSELVGVCFVEKADGIDMKAFWYPYCDEIGFAFISGARIRVDLDDAKSSFFSRRRSDTLKATAHDDDSIAVTFSRDANN